MLTVIALGIPLILAAIVVAAMVPATAPPVEMGLAEADRTGLMLMVPIMSFCGSVLVSSVYASWMGGWRRLPSWMWGWIAKDSRTPDPRFEHGLTRHATNLDRRGQIRLVIETIIKGIGWLVLVVPVFPLLLLWLRSDLYRPWEAAMVTGSAVASLAWVVYLLNRYRRLAHR